MTNIESIQKLHFSLGGYFSDYNYTLNYDHGTLEIERMEMPYNGFDLKVKKINAGKKGTLIASLNELKILDWKKEYNLDMCDGTQWELKITYNGNLKKKVYGSNDFPESFNDFLNILRAFITNKAFFGRDWA